MQFTNDKPIFEQIMEYIIIKIASGEYKKEDKIYSVREYATMLGVNPNTVQRALFTLEGKGVIYSKRGDGRYVGDVEIATKLRNDIARNSVKRFMVEMKQIGVSKYQILSIVEDLDLWVYCK